MVPDSEIQDKIFDELNMYQNELGSFGKDIATRQRRNENFDPGKLVIHLIMLQSEFYYHLLNLTCSYGL